MRKTCVLAACLLGIGQLHRSIPQSNSIRDVQPEPSQLSSSSAAVDTTLGLALLRAAEENDTASVKSLLAKHAPVDFLTTNGWSALTYAVKEGSYEMAAALIEKGADVNRKSNTAAGSTILCFAAESANLKLIELLLKKGADINARSRNGTTPLCYAIDHQKMELIKLLVSKGADVNLPGVKDREGEPCSPLGVAGSTGNHRIVQILLDAGADVRARNSYGDTALMGASKCPYPQIVKLLIEKGSEVNDRAYAAGHTPLTYAAYNGRLDNIKELLAAGADPFVTAFDATKPIEERVEYTAAEWAMQRGHPEAARLILKAQIEWAKKYLPEEKPVRVENRNRA